LADLIKLAELELSECEKKFNAIFSHGAVGIARIAMDTSCLEVNQKLCEILGYSEAELMTLSFREVTHPEDLDKNAALVAEIVTGKRDSYSLEKRYIRKNGDIIWCRLSASLVKDSENKPLYAVAFVEDISDRIKLTERLQLSDQIVTASSDMLAILDMNGIYKATNSSYSKIFGGTPNFLVGKHIEKVFGKKFVASTMQPNIARAIKGELASYSAWFDFPNNSKRFLNVSYSPVEDGDKKISGIAVSARDITDLKNAEIEMLEMNVKLEEYSFVDGLTKIANRRMLDENLTKEWDRAQRAKAPLAFIMIDIDFFKKYNDHYGHLQGDDCLIKVARILNEIANRSTDIIARFGGEEFAILAPYSALDQALKLAEICRLAIAQENIPHAFTGDPKLNTVTISIGVSSLVPNGKNSAMELIKAADRLLYKAKSAGRNCVRSA